MDIPIHKPNSDWFLTPDGNERGYIQPHALDELWIHTGTRCNLACDFCLEGAGPDDKRLQTPKFTELKPHIDEALTLGVKQFSFTGGEPFLIKDIITILAYASKFRPCLVLTNGTDPLLKRLPALLAINPEHHPISLRISIDYADATKHDRSRGTGNFAKAIVSLKKLYQQGFKVSVARHIANGENTDEVDQAFKALFALNGLPEDLPIIAFPDFLPPGSITEVPHITKHCMTHYHNEAQRKQFMCSNSKMIIKKQSQLHIVACTLVDDDDDYVLSTSLTASLDKRISMKHHRCYSCFAYGSSCSEKSSES
jgi:MoaA/NifB/PqqE/SkfB family radical SAM enzyme